MGRKLNLKHPKSFNEKLQWLKINDENESYVDMLDKAAAKKYVAGIIGEDHIISTIGIWDSFDKIDFDLLPNEFVLKCTHDSGSVVVCTDKATFDYDKAKIKLEDCMVKKYYRQSREWPYKYVKPQIMAERFLSDEVGKTKGLSDYKFFCFNGEPKFLYYSEGLASHSDARLAFLSLEWQFAPYRRRDYLPMETLPSKPFCYDEMLEICKKLSANTKFMRVDLYEVNRKIYFSEITLYPCGSYMPFENEHQDVEMGKLLQL